MNDIAKEIVSRGIGCHMLFICTGIFLYADDLFLIAPSVHTLQIMLNICETELNDSICALTLISPYVCVLGCVLAYNVLI